MHRYANAGATRIDTVTGGESKAIGHAVGHVRLLVEVFQTDRGSAFQRAGGDGDGGAVSCLGGAAVHTDLDRSTRGGQGGNPEWNHSFSNAVDDGQVGRALGKGSDQAVGGDRNDGRIGDEVPRAGDGGAEAVVLLWPGQHLARATDQQRDRLRIRIQADRVEVLLIFVGGYTDAEGGGRLNTMAGHLDDAAAIGQGGDAAIRRNSQRVRVGRQEAHIRRRQKHILLVGEVAHDLQQLLLATSQVELARAEVEIDQRCIADVEADEYWRRRVEAIIDR